MTDNRTTELREKLNKLIIELDRLDTTLDLPASDMTLGEYEQEREKLLDGFMQAIAATLGEQIVRCRDCRHATISTTGVCKYCEMFVLPDTDGYGADPQVNLPLDFFCGFAERKEVN